MNRLSIAFLIGVATILPCSQATARPPSDPASAAGGPQAVLDASFGQGGLVRLTAEVGGDQAVGAEAKGSHILVSGGLNLRSLLDSGQIESAFGARGKLMPGSARGRSFFLSGFTLDRRGRILLVGTSRATKYEVAPDGGPAQLNPATARVMRFLPNGHPDRSFGRHGVVETAFGLPPPHDEAGIPLQTQPSVEATGIAIGPKGLIVITGSANIGLGPSCIHDVFYPVAESAAFVARLKPNGATDPAFGSNGVVGGLALGETPLRAGAVGEPVVGPGGVITYRSTAVSFCRQKHGKYGLGQLTWNGNVRRALGGQGALEGRFTAITEGLGGSVVAVARLPWRQGEAFRVRLVRIAADGKLDQSFGKQGQTLVELGSDGFSSPDSVSVDRTGRVLLGGTLLLPERSVAFLLRLDADGQREMSFGPNGRVITSIPNLAESGPSDMFFDRRGRLVTVHRYDPPARRSGLAVARYLIHG